MFLTRVKKIEGHDDSPVAYWTVPDVRTHQESILGRLAVLCLARDHDDVTLLRLDFLARLRIDVPVDERLAGLSILEF